MRKPVHFDEKHAAHRERQRRYRRRKKYGAVIPKYKLREDVLLKYVPKGVGGTREAIYTDERHVKLARKAIEYYHKRNGGQSYRPGYRMVFALMGIGHQSLAQLRRCSPSRETRMKMCEYVNVDPGDLFERIN